METKTTHNTNYTNHETELEFLTEYFKKNYESIIIGFIIELAKQNVRGRNLGKELAKITEIFRSYNA